MHMLVWILFGLAVGIVAKVLMPGRDPGGFVLTVVLGIVGAFVGGFLGRTLGWYRDGDPVGFVMAVFALTAEQELEAKILEDKIRVAVEKEVTAMARLWASLDSRGPTATPVPISAADSARYTTTIASERRPITHRCASRTSGNSRYAKNSDRAISSNTARTA